MQQIEDIPVGVLLRSLVFQVHAALGQGEPDPEVIRGLMWRAAALKGQLRGGPSNELMRYLDSVQRRIGRAYSSSPTPESRRCAPSAERHAA
ncbi:MAG: hypothetical protein P4L84_21845 [Isosphaeraceae bacterium]|nr:hypothetical protein [Isosphaeraceae bacterium]